VACIKLISPENRMDVSLLSCVSIWSVIDTALHGSLRVCAQIRTHVLHMFARIRPHTFND
jgi:hypothetical protein